MKRLYDEEPDPRDEDDPEYKLEMFETFKAMGWTPEHIRDPKYRREYAEWLEQQTPDEK